MKKTEKTSGDLIPVSSFKDAEYVIKVNQKKGGKATKRKKPEETPEISRLPNDQHAVGGFGGNSGPGSGDIHIHLTKNKLDEMGISLEEFKKISPQHANAATQLKEKVEFIMIETLNGVASVSGGTPSFNYG